jgi:hypothetical protein
MFNSKSPRQTIFTGFAGFVLLLALIWFYNDAAGSFTIPRLLKTNAFLPLLLKTGPNHPPSPGEYILLGWNDLGMHCYNRDFRDLAVLPPYNTLWAQVIHRGDPPQIVTEGLTVEYFFPDNTYSVGKSNFWDYDLQLFGVDLPPDVGLTGKGLAGKMDPQGDYFVAHGIPLTEFDDGNLSKPQPYQLAEIIAKDSQGTVLANLQVVAPVSTEMHCDTCHHDYGVETSPPVGLRRISSHCMIRKIRANTRPGTKDH